VLTFLRIGVRDVAITGCWTNVNAPGAVHRMHAHPNNFLSGVFYAQVQDGADTINLHDPVDANRSERPRISISFNAMFTAFAETMGSRYGAHREGSALPLQSQRRSRT
jgi:hypothetical protein